MGIEIESHSKKFLPFKLLRERKREKEGGGGREGGRERGRERD